MAAPSGFGVRPPPTLALAGKRAVDLTVAGLLLLLLWPLLLWTAVRLRRQLGGPVLESSPAAGRDGRAFALLRFRMLDPGPPVRPGPSLQRLLQLVNVLRGDMSLVGPRPLTQAEAEHGGSLVRRRGRLRPGILGWAQINRHEVLNRQQRLELDLWYVDNWSLRLDAYILREALLTKRQERRRKERQ